MIGRDTLGHHQITEANQNLSDIFYVTLAWCWARNTSFYCITLNIFNLRLHKQKRKSLLQMKKYGKQSIFADHVTYLNPYFDFLLSLKKHTTPTPPPPTPKKCDNYICRYFLSKYMNMNCSSLIFDFVLFLLTC